MKILWLSHLIPYPPKGGVLQRSFNLVKELAEANEVHLVCFIQPALLDHIYPDIQTACNETKKHLGQYCSHIEYLPIPSDASRFGKHLLALKSLFSTDSYTVNWLKSDGMHELLAQLPDKESYDVVHYDTISLVPYLKYFPDNKRVLDHHNIESHMMFRRSYEESNLFKKAYFYLEALKIRHAERKYCKHFDLNITCSKLDTERLYELMPGTPINAVDVPNGVDVEYFKPDSSIKKIPNSLIFAGGLDWYPNVKAINFFVREVWPKLKDLVPDVTFNLIGKSPTDEMLAVARNDANFIAHGFVDDIRTYMNASWIYICPIDDGGGTKLKILDALAMSKAIIAHPIACEGIDVENGHNVLFAETPEEYINQIMLLLGDQKKCIEIGNNARKLIESKYAYSIIGNNIRLMYKSLARN